MATYNQTEPESNLKILVDRIVAEEVSFGQERRSAHRTSLVRPVLVQIGDQEPLFGVSRNISENGLGLIMREPLPIGTSAKLTIHTLKGPPIAIRSEVRWCVPFGNDWFSAGWHFIIEVRS